MEFYHAHGEANACGFGCSEWIAAEGKIDNGTADRLQRLLSQLHGARLPIFLHSPGGAINGSMELGRLIRALKITTSVGRTTPLSCERGAAGEKSCAAQISAGRQIEAELGPPSTAMCNSACVFALAGGVVRLIPPGVTLGIHDTGFDPALAKRRHLSAQALEFAQAATHAQLRKYVHAMGIDDGLLTEAFAIPFTSVGRLTRDDAARFGLDRREFAETGWLFDGSLPAITKIFFLRTGNSERHYVNAIVRVSCMPWPVLLFSREQLRSDPEPVAGEQAVSMSVNGQDIPLPRRRDVNLYQRTGQFPAAIFEAAPDDATIVLPGTELGRQQGPSGDITLAMAGFSAAYKKLRNLCAPKAPQALQSPPSTSALQWPSSTIGLRTPPSTSPPPLHPTPVGVGASRDAVDAALGAPTETVGATALYSYTSAAGERKIMVGYFDGSGHLQRFARYILKDGKVFDEISETELSKGQELPPVSRLLATGQEAKRALQAAASTSALQTPPSTRPPPLRPAPVGIGASRDAVDAALGVPTETVGATALYSYASAAGERKIMAAYFDGSGRLQRFARYVLKDGKVFDEISGTDLSEGQEFVPLSDLLATPTGRDPNS